MHAGKCCAYARKGIDDDFCSFWAKLCVEYAPKRDLS